jgi:hypothetical protein
MRINYHVFHKGVQGIGNYYQSQRLGVHLPQPASGSTVALVLNLR